MSRWFILSGDLLICIFSLFFATLLRFNFNVSGHDKMVFYYSLPIFVLIRLSFMLFLKTYEGIIFYTSTEDARRIFISMALGTGLLGLVNFIDVSITGKYLIPFSILIIDFFITLVTAGGGRILVKLMAAELQNSNQKKLPVLIYGAGRMGIITKHTLERHIGYNYDFVAFIDDKKALCGRRIEGVPILGGSHEFKSALRNGKLLVLAAQLEPARKKEVINLALEAGVRILDVPPVSNWIKGELTFNQIKQVRIEDLLQREPIKLDIELIKAQITGKHVLITGAAGTIGSEIARQVLAFEPAALVLIDQAETPLFELESDFTSQAPRFPVFFYMADITCRDRMKAIFCKHHPQIVFHAAAYKHVPVMEHNPTEAVRTNILGTKICAELAMEVGVSRFVMVSTDKAVNPTNVMGATKRVAEIFVQTLNNSLSNQFGTRFITTRFGNVLGSNGSVIPIFKKQIENNGPVTVTHPDVTRYFMTIPEACQLVLEAGAIGNGGEIYIFDMGAPVKIIDLAHEMIRLSGLEPGKDIEIKYTGLRPGEKLYEELLNNKENTIPTHHPKIMIARVHQYSPIEVELAINALTECIENDAGEDAVRVIKSLVPEYISNNSIFEKLDSRAPAEIEILD